MITNTKSSRLTLKTYRQNRSDFAKYGDYVFDKYIFLLFAPIRCFSRYVVLAPRSRINLVRLTNRIVLMSRSTWMCESDAWRTGAEC